MPINSSFPAKATNDAIHKNNPGVGTVSILPPLQNYTRPRLHNNNNNNNHAAEVWIYMNATVSLDSLR